MLTLFLVRRFVEVLSRLEFSRVKLDYIGIALLTLGIGALQVLLDKGQEDDWFGSHFITTLIVTATVCLISLAIWEWFHKSPIIDVRMFRNFNFASASLMMFMLGIMLFSSLVLMPQFLDAVGLHLPTGRARAFGRGSGFADRDAHHGAIDRRDCRLAA